MVTNLLPGSKKGSFCTCLWYLVCLYSSEFEACYLTLTDKKEKQDKNEPENHKEWSKNGSFIEN